MSDDSIENVLILQGGGSLGAFGCGVFKTLFTTGSETNKADFASHILTTSL